MHHWRQYLYISLIILIISCSRLAGKIEIRNIGCDEGLSHSKEVYLVNDSRHKKYQFTVKKTEIENDTLISYETNLHVLEPGEEEYLGCDQWFSKTEYSKKEIRTKNPFRQIYMIFPDGSEGEIVAEDYEDAIESGAKLSPKFRWANDIIKIYWTYDTVINSRHNLYIKYLVPDSTLPLPRVRYRIIYEVTGQREVKGNGQ